MSAIEAPKSIAMADLVAAMRQATEDVFSTMLGMELAMQEAFIEKASVAAPASGVVSLIGFAGSWVGTGSLFCSAELARRMSGALLAVEHEKLDEDVLDSIAEITNMVIGNVKTALEEKLETSLGLSTPTVVFGLNFQTRSARNHEWTVVPFVSGPDSLYVQMCLAPSKDAAGRATRPGFALPQVLNF